MMHFEVPRPVGYDLMCLVSRILATDSSSRILRNRRLNTMTHRERHTECRQVKRGANRKRWADVPRKRDRKTGCRTMSDESVDEGSHRSFTSGAHLGLTMLFSDRGLLSRNQVEAIVHDVGDAKGVRIELGGTATHDDPEVPDDQLAHDVARPGTSDKQFQRKDREWTSREAVTRACSGSVACARTRSRTRRTPPTSDRRGAP